MFHNQAIKVLIIGCGNIGSFFDGPETSEVLSYAHAFSGHPGFRLQGFVDVDQDKARQASIRWNTNYYYDLPEAMDKCQPQVVCIAVPDDYHFKILSQLADYQTKIIIAEKPLTKTVAEAEHIVSIYDKSSTTILVNYTRRFVPEFNNLRNDITSGKFGSYLNGTGYYGKGLLHNGSHLLDLLRFFLGDITSGEVLGYDCDFSNDDPSISAVLQLRNGRKFVLQNVDCRAYTIFEMELFFEKKRIRIIDSGFQIEEYSVTENHVFKGYYSLAADRQVRTSLDRAMHWVADSTYKYLQNQDSVPCTLYDGYAVVKLYDDLKKAVKI